MIPISVEIVFEVERDAFTACCRELAERSIEAAARYENLKYPENAELSLLLGDDARLQALNKQWRQKDKPTNVLSFPGSNFETGQVNDPFLGDIAISLDRVKAEAELENKTPNDHFMHLVIHGFLHLFGYDHETEEDAEIMEAMEVRILARLGVEDPYMTVCE